MPSAITVSHSRHVHTFGKVASRPMEIPGQRISWKVGQMVTTVFERGMSGGMVLDAQGHQVGLIVGGYGALGAMVLSSAVWALMG
jgi:hypothetical protein